MENIYKEVQPDGVTYDGVYVPPIRAVCLKPTHNWVAGWLVLDQQGSSVTLVFVSLAMHIKQFVQFERCMNMKSCVSVF